jgi:hypothetical protein
VQRCTPAQMMDRIDHFIASERKLKIPEAVIPRSTQRN